jgi:hypothetical protein
MRFEHNILWLNHGSDVVVWNLYDVYRETIFLESCQQKDCQTVFEWYSSRFKIVAVEYGSIDACYLITGIRSGRLLHMLADEMDKCSLRNIAAARNHKLLFKSDV